MDPKYYEVQCSERLCKAIFQITDISSSYNTECVRLFLLDSSNQAIFSKARKMLEDCKWAMAKENEKSINFDKIEIDILLHVEAQLSEKVDLGKGFYLLKSDTPIQSEKLLKHQISDAAIDSKANAYILAEVTKDKTADMAKRKMYQMERDLTFLLARAQIKFDDANITIGNIVRLAALITPTAHIQEVTEFLIQNHSILPRLYSLLQQNRVYLGKVKPRGDSDYISAMMRGWNSASDVISSISNTSQPKQRLIRVGHAGKIVDVNVSDCASWADFEDKVHRSGRPLLLTGSIAAVYRIDKGIPIFVNAVDALIVNETYYVATSEDPLPAPVSPATISFKTMEEFYGALRAIGVTELQMKKIRDVFEDQEIIPSVLSNLTYEELEKAGVKQIGLRKSIWKVLGK